jgi:hypothetical protein
VYSKCQWSPGPGGDSGRFLARSNPARYCTVNGDARVGGVWSPNPQALLDCFPHQESAAPVCDWYRIVDSLVGIESQDLRFQSRFRQLYGEFLCSPPRIVDRVEQIHCRVQVSDGASTELVTITTPEKVEMVDFILDLYRDRGYVEMHDGPADWRSVGLARSGQPLLISKGAQLLVDTAQPWQPLIATCVMNLAMRVQSELLFFHAATVGIGGAGVLMTGDKGAGKSTLSMALGAQGHEFFGDEVAAVRWQTLELAPFRRAVSVRPGPQAPRVEKILGQTAYFSEKFPDGTIRRRAEASKLFPRKVADSLPLRWVFFLRSFEDRPRAEAFVPRANDLRLLAPLPCTFLGASPAVTMMRVAKILSQVNCYFLHPGLPEETARLVEGIVRAG